MKMSKRILSSILAILMVVSVCSVGFTANVGAATGSVLEEIVLEPVARPVVDFSCTEVTRVAKAVNSVEPGNVVVKSTPSGVPELSGSYAAQAYAGETPVATTITFSSPTPGILVNGFSCNNPDVTLSAVSYSGGAYVATIESGTIAANEDGTYNPLVFTVDYTWTDGNTYQEKCVSYVEGISTGGVFGMAQGEVQALSGTGSYYRVWASAITRLLGKGVYYEQPATIETRTEDPYISYGVYNVATGAKIENVASGYNTSFFTNDRTDKPAGKHNQAAEFDVVGATNAHVYVDSSVANTLADQNIRLDANVGELSDRNNDNPYTALADAWVSAGTNVDSLVKTNDATAQAAIGLAIPAKANHGVTGFEKDAALQTLTGKVGQYGNIFTSVLTGNVANLVDGSSYTITTKYYAYMWNKTGLLQHYNMTSSVTVPTAMTFHIVDKGALRDAINAVMNTDPENATARAQGKGVNPQAWYYKSGFAAFQTAYVNALDVLNNPKASQADINAKTTALNNAYKSLTFNGADYTQVNALKSEAQALKKNAAIYTPDSVAVLDEAISGVKTGYTILFQGAVDTMARNLDTAMKNLKLNSADYSIIDAKKLEFMGLYEEDYVPSTWEAAEQAFAAVQYGKYADEQALVDEWATAVVKAMNNLIKIADLANWEGLNDALADAKAVTGLENYENGKAVTDAIAAAEAAKKDNDRTLWSKDRQGEIDTLEQNLIDAVANLTMKKADKTALAIALGAELPENTACYNQATLLDYQALVAQATIMNDDNSLTILDQSKVNKMASDLTAKYNELLGSLSHTPGEATVENNIPATCTTAGSYETVTVCTVCGVEISRVPTTVDALGHTEGEEIVKNYVEATCTTAGGYDTVKYCTVCGEVAYNVHTTIDALPHTETVLNAVAPTCTSTGLTEGKKCEVCGTVTVAQITIDKIAHTPADAVVENEVPATFESEGSYDSVVYCSVCGSELSRDTFTIPALDHTAAAAVEENRVEPTCTDKGSYDLVVYCDCCEEKVELSRQTKEIDALGHTNGTPVEENRVEKTCLVDGSYDTVVYCTVCNAEVSRDTTVIKAMGKHVDGKATEENRVEATCSAAGSYDMVTRCRACNEVTKTVNYEIAKLAHNYDEVVTAPTCTAEGYTTYTCTACGDTYTDNVTAKADHAYDAVVTDPTCTAEGYTTYTCKVCADTYTDDVTDKVAHAYDTEVTEPTCTTEGYTTYTCTACGDSYTDDVIPAAHTEGEAVVENNVDPDCVNAGSYDTVVYCTVCSEELSRVKTDVDALGHTPGEWVETVAPQVGVEGEETLYCEVCDAVLETRPVAALEIAAYLKAAEGSTTVIDKERGFIYGLDEGIYDLEGYVEYVGGELEYSDIGTGAKVDFIVNGEVAESYTIVIFGDVTGDGVIDTLDTAELAKVVNLDIEFAEDSAEAFAADIANIGDGIDTFDLALLYQVVNLDTVIDQGKTAEEIA